jgi:hypothetical protein
MSVAEGEGRAVPVGLTVVVAVVVELRETVVLGEAVGRAVVELSVVVGTKVVDAVEDGSEADVVADEQLSVVLTAVNLYTFKYHGPPHISVASPLHGMLHLEAS